MIAGTIEMKNIWLLKNSWMITWNKKLWLMIFVKLFSHLFEGAMPLVRLFSPELSNNTKFHTTFFDNFSNHFYTITCSKSMVVWNILMNIGIVNNRMCNFTQTIIWTFVCTLLIWFAHWSKNTTSKGLCHITILENAIHESMDDNFICVKHIHSGLCEHCWFIYQIIVRHNTILTLRDLIVESTTLFNQHHCSIIQWD